MNSTDPKTRMDAMAKADKILIKESPIVPMIQATRVYVQHQALRGVLRRTVAPDPDFYYAKISKRMAKKKR